MTTTKLTKIIACILMVMMLATISTSTVFAKDKDKDTTKGLIDPGAITGTYDKVDNEGITEIANKVVGLIRNIAVVAGVILLTIIGVKFMMGSAEEKADYKKSLVPLVVGIIVVMASTQIASMIFSFF